MGYFSPVRRLLEPDMQCQKQSLRTWVRVSMEVPAGTGMSPAYHLSFATLWRQDATWSHRMTSKQLWSRDPTPALTHAQAAA
jgi:hypothetical protein